MFRLASTRVEETPHRRQNVEEFYLDRFALDAATLRAAGATLRKPLEPPGPGVDDGAAAYVAAHARTWCDVWEDGSRTSAIPQFLSLIHISRPT